MDKPISPRPGAQLPTKSYEECLEVLKLFARMCRDDAKYPPKVQRNTDDFMYDIASVWSGDGKRTKESLMREAKRIESEEVVSR